jgi:DnaJ-domain-containing protein 1
MISNDLVRKLTPEEEELAKKKAELDSVEAELTQRELDLVTLHGELHSFERQYQQIIGMRYLELDRIEAQIEEYMAYLEEAQDFAPSESLKQLYRQIAKKVHPDLATDEAERVRRQEVMSAVNQAYEEGNEEQLREILHQWESSPETVQGEGVGAELIRALRKISQSRDRLKHIEGEFLAVQETDLYQLREQVIEAKSQGKNLLEDMASTLDERISAAKCQLEELKNNLDSKDL